MFVFDLIIKGGFMGILIMVVLFLLFSGAIYIYVERILVLRHTKKANKDTLYRILESPEDDVIGICKDSDAPIAKLMSCLTLKKDKSYQEITKVIEDVASLELHRLEKNVSLLATTASVAPMIGFLGTVIGMVLAFYNLSQGGGDIEISLLADGIYVAMTTTVAGLIVGIFSNLAYNHLVIRTENLVYVMQTEVVKKLNFPAVTTN